jgi:Flp pilus assembly protein TadG
MRSNGRAREESGMVTAELAACLPVLMLLLAVALSAISVASARVRVQDAAREAARAAARGDPATARELAAQAAPGSSVQFAAGGDAGAGLVTARVDLHVYLLVTWLPSVTVHGQAVAALEPSAQPP